jgi:cytidylate kinase
MRVWREDRYGVRTPEVIPLSEDAVLALVKKAILSAYNIGNVIIVGRGGQVLLQDMPGTLHIRIEAPMEDRTQRVKAQMKLEQRNYQADVDARRAAQDWIESRDAASADYIKRFYNASWSDPMLYHLILNTGKLSIEQAAQMIINVVHAIYEEPQPA